MEIILLSVQILRIWLLSFILFIWNLDIKILQENLNNLLYFNDVLIQI